MSRIGRLPVAVPAGVTVDIKEGNDVTVKGPKGTLQRVLPEEMSIKLEDGQVIVTRPNDLKKMKSLHGLTRTLIHNMVVGVSEGYEKVLEVNGVGYRAAKQGKKLVLNLGYSHPVEMEDPAGLESAVDGNKITVKGIDKEKVGQYAAEIRDKRRPEPYKGKGIKYADEVIRRKVGKTGKKQYKESVKMINKVSRAQVRQKKHRRMRNHIAGTAARPRLAVFRSNSHMYAQIIDDTVGHTLVSASTLQKDVKAELEKTNDVKAAAYLGTVIGKKAVEAGIKEVVFDRGGFIYQGKIQALADAAREAGLEF